jgi:hypothetical protein
MDTIISALGIATLVVAVHSWPIVFIKDAPSQPQIQHKTRMFAEK